MSTSEFRENVGEVGSNEDLSNDSDDTLKLRKFYGDTIVEHAPLYSPNSEFLFTICKNIVQIYSATTGQLFKILEGSKFNIIGLEYEIANDKILVACTEYGEVMKWKWELARLESNFQLMSKQYKIQTFHLLDISSINPSALVIFTRSGSENKCWSIVNINTGQKLKCPLKMNLTLQKVHVAAETKFFHYFVVVQAEKMYAINYKNWQLVRWINAQRIPFTCVKCHPTEEMIVTGDALGRIFLWREFSCRTEPKTTLYHWHHTEITSIAFTNVGSGFYSSGLEAVLVKWNIDNPELKHFLPRMAACINHVAVSNKNKNVAVATADNGVYILDDQMNVNCVLQNFTYILDDKTRLNKFPVGLKLNPRFNCLILNGRTGHLQFYSTYTKNLLYNMDVVIQNPLSMENQKILYNVQVTKAAFNLDWMATGEIWNDQEHLSELRLKFWEFQKGSESYCLNTNIELPHEEGFKVLEFSDLYQSDNLLCVSVGNDNVIKMWTLTDCENIYKKRKMWCCTGRADFRNMPIESVNFSPDGSLLAAGFGNCLCLYKSENLKIKAVFSAPKSNDGVAKKLQIRIPKIEELKKGCIKSLNKNNDNRKQKKLLELANLIENNQLELITRVKKSESISFSQINVREFVEMKSNKTSSNILFERILSLVELNLFQKLCLYQKLETFCTVSNKMQNKILNYIALAMLNTQQVECKLNQRIFKIEIRKKFKAKYRLYKYFNRRKLSETVKNKLISFEELLNLPNDSTKNSQKIDEFKNITKLNGFCDFNQNVNRAKIANQHLDPAVQSTSSIKRVLFATADFAHLIVVCMEHRVLIWNILTLKLQCVLKLSVLEITIDPITSLFAAFTTNNELYVFLPNAPMPLYHKTNLPNIESACWIPRKYPKSQSINLDWQSTSMLYFITEKQELMYLSSDNDSDNLGTNFTQVISEVHQLTHYTTFGTHATKQMNSKKSRDSSTNDFFPSIIDVLGNYSIKSLINMPTHAMAPANLLCHSYTRSLVEVEKNNELKFSYREITKRNFEIYGDGLDNESFGKKNKSNRKSTVLKDNRLIKIKENRKLRKVFDESVDISF